MGEDVRVDICKRGGGEDAKVSTLVCLFRVSHTSIYKQKRSLREIIKSLHCYCGSITVPRALVAPYTTCICGGGGIWCPSERKGKSKE